jgi:hypothetical protein
LLQNFAGGDAKLEEKKKEKKQNIYWQQTAMNLEKHIVPLCKGH